MRLYVNTKEVPFLKDALQKAITNGATYEEIRHLSELLARVTLCEELQNNERRAKHEEVNNGNGSDNCNEEA